MEHSALNRQILSKVRSINAKISHLRTLSQDETTIAHNGGTLAGRITTMILVLERERDDLIGLVWKS
jgi:hypothetical protein